MNHITDNQDALLDYIYEEGDPAERLRVATHLQQCAACAVAVLEFQNVRGMLKDWTPPASDLGFRVVQERTPTVPVSPVDQSGWWRRGFTSYKGMLQAAAAVLLFVAGMAVSQMSVDYQDGIVTVRTRPAAEPPPSFGGASITLPAEARIAPRGTDTMTVDDIQRIIREAGTQGASADTEVLLQRVRAMIDQSEQRQQRELALRLSQVAREVDTQHKADLIRIEQDFGQQQEATLNYLVKTSGGAK